MKSIVLAALLGATEAYWPRIQSTVALKQQRLATIEKDAQDSEDSEDSEEETHLFNLDGQAIQVKTDAMQDEYVNGYKHAWYQPWDSSDEPGAAYTRKVPVKYSMDGGGDVMVGSMIRTYAVEEKKCEDPALFGTSAACVPTGNFFVKKSSGKMAAKEVIGTHLGLKGTAAKSYLDEYYDKAWAHFDIAGAGLLGVDVMPSFYRFLCSNQSIELGQ